MHCAHKVIEEGGIAGRIQTCSEHARAVAELAGARLEACGLENTGYLAGLLHDCGKFTDEFDAYLDRAVRAVRGEAVRKGSVIHTFAGVGYLLGQFHSQDGNLIFSDITAEILALGVGCHHGLVDLWDEQHQSGFAHRRTHQCAYDARAIAAFHEECADEEELRRLFQRADAELLCFYKQKMLPGVRDEQEAWFALGLLARLVTSAVVDGDRTDTRCFMKNVPHPAFERPDWQECVRRISAHTAAFPSATPIQRARGVFSQACAAGAEQKIGLYRLDLPTGGGKTLAALRFAACHAQKNGLRRIIYTAPLLSIIDQNAASIREAVGDSVAVLEHHSNLLKDDSHAEKLSQTELLQEAWDAPVIITTFVQLLNTLFSGKMSSVRRFHALCESVIVIDEVQSLPPRMLSMFNGAVNFLVSCCRATVLLCSATQPAFDKAQHPMLPCKRVIDKPLFDRYAPLFKRTSIEDAGHCSLSELASRSAELIKNTDSLLIVCNTKREAADLMGALEGMPNVKLFHLSAGMCMAHRKQTLEALSRALEEREKLICVSTQLIEAGVDVSFGAVIRLAAGLDNIVQTAGRCNRHGEYETPQSVYICHLSGEKLGSLSDIQASQNALNVLLEEYKRSPARYSNDLASDAAIRDYYTALYRGMARGAQDYPTRGQTLFDLLSENKRFAPEEAASYYFRQAFKTAGECFEVFESAQESVLVPYAEGAALIKELEKLSEELSDRRAEYDLGYVEALLQRAKPYAVSLPVSQIERMQQCGMVYSLLHSSLFVLKAGFYDACLGV